MSTNTRDHTVVFVVGLLVVCALATALAIMNDETASAIAVVMLPPTGLALLNLLKTSRMESELNGGLEEKIRRVVHQVLDERGL